jgi:tight adherence protein B
MQYLILLCGAFLTVTFLIVGLGHILFSPRLAMLARLKMSTMPPSALQEREAVRVKEIGGNLKRYLGMLGSVLSRRVNTKAIQQKLLRAHILMRVEEFIGLTIFCGAVIFIVTSLLSGMIWLAVLLGLIGLKIPGLYADLKKNRRLNALILQLPEALNIVSNGLRAGYSFPQALSVVSKEIGPPIGEEFSRVIWENRMGKTLEEVLHNLGERVGSEDLNLIITALLIQKQVGGNLAEILDNISHTIRERIKIKNEIKTLTAQGRLSAVIIIMLPLGVVCFLLMVNPEYMLGLVRETLGLIMLGLALILQFMGILIIRKIVNIEV